MQEEKCGLCGVGIFSGKNMILPCVFLHSPVCDVSTDNGNPLQDPQGSAILLAVYKISQSDPSAEASRSKTSRPVVRHTVEMNREPGNSAGLPLVPKSPPDIQTNIGGVSSIEQIRALFPNPCPLLSPFDEQ